MRSVLMLAALVAATGGCLGPVDFPPISKERQARIDYLSDQAAGGGRTAPPTTDQYKQEVRASQQEYEQEKKLKTGKFPPVQVGMSYAELKAQIAELNPPYVDKYGDKCKNVWVERVSQFEDTKTVQYTVMRGRLTDFPPRTVLITVRDDVVIGFSR